MNTNDPRKSPPTLRSIYEEDGSMPDMSKLDRTHDRRWARSFIYFVGILALSSAVAYFGFRLLIPSSPGSVVSLSIDAPEHVTAGSKIMVVVNYENKDRNPLALATLKVRYPKEFVVESVSPRSDDDTLTSWTLGALDRHSRGSIEINGRIYGDIGTTPQIQSTFTYKPSSFNAEFSTVANKTLSIDTAPVELTFDGPSEASAGQSITFTVRYKNTTDTPLANAQLVFAPGAAFSLSKSSRPPLRDTTWSLPTLSPGTSGELTITGSVTSAAAAATSLPFSLVTNVKREQVVLSKAAYALTVAQGDLGISIERDTDNPVRLGDTMNGRVVISNNSSVSLGDITVQLSSAASLEWKESTSPVAIASARGGLTWSNADKLKTLPAGERFAIPFTIKAPGAGSTALSSLNFSASAKALKRDGKSASLAAKSPDFVVPVGSNISADAYALYYDDGGIPLGSGPLPPRVGEETKYRVVWKIKNGARDLTDIALVSTLPENMAFGSKQGVGAGTIIYDADSRTVRWSISRLPTNVPEVVAQFDLVLTPTADDQGKSAELLGAGTLTARDALVDEPITTAISRLTTDLPRDTKAVGRGVVLP